MITPLYKIPVFQDYYIYTFPAPLAIYLDKQYRQMNKNQEVNCIVNLLSHKDISDLKLKNEKQIANTYNMDYYHFPITDFGVPENDVEFLQQVKLIVDLIKNRKIVAIHSKAGIGRSSLFAASIISSFKPKTEGVFDYISIYRKEKVPDTDKQIEWFNHFFERHLMN